MRFSSRETGRLSKNRLSEFVKREHFLAGIILCYKFIFGKEFLNLKSD